MLTIYTDPGLLWLDDEPEPDPIDVAGGLVWWSAAPLDTDD